MLPEFRMPDVFCKPLVVSLLSGSFGGFWVAGFGLWNFLFFKAGNGVDILSVTDKIPPKARRQLF